VTNEIGKRQLDGLTREQIAIWMTDDVTGKRDPAQAERAEVKHAFTLLRGLKEALPVEVSLDGDGFEDLAWDRATLDRLRAQQSELVDALHANERGSEEHRRLSGQIGPINRRVAVLDLYLHLDEMLAEPPDAVTALLAAKPLLESARSAVRRLGGRGSAEVIGQIRDATGTIQTSPREGRHVTDENTLDGYFRAFTGGCLRVDNGSNKVSLIEHIAGAQYKIARGFNGDALEARGFARLYRFSFPGWTHKHGIQLDILREGGGGTNLNAETRRMMHEHMLAKAEAMGVPYLTSDDAALQLAEERGLEVLKSEKVAFHVDHGHTGLHHAQNIDYGTYWILWKHAHSYGSALQEPDESTEATRDYTKHVILPKSVRLEDQP
jgi:hypothetical protein